jgi:hypothetical protein
MHVYRISEIFKESGLLIAVLKFAQIIVMYGQSYGALQLGIYCICYILQLTACSQVHNLLYTECTYCTLAAAMEEQLHGCHNCKSTPSPTFS